MDQHAKGMRRSSIAIAYTWRQRYAT